MRIVVLTKNYGKNVTGATLATHTFLHYWANNPVVSEIIVLAQHLYEYEVHPNIHIIKYSNRYAIPHLIKTYDDKHTIFYSDDHYGGFLADAKVKYVHTYHGNWPDARWLNLEYFFKSFYFIAKYAKTIKHAVKVVNVSNYMKKFTDQYNKNSITIRNGVDDSKLKEIHRQKYVRLDKCIMLGNVDSRKYGKLPELVNELANEQINMSVDIFGRIIDEKLAERLRKYEKINLHGFIPFSKIDLSQYAFLLSTSTRENLPISIVEILRSGLPVLAFNVGGISEVVDESSGRLLDTEDMKMNAKIISQVADQKVEFTFDNQKELEEFDWGKSAEKYMDIFKSIII